jgi:O-antigen/teichoic acid export membrane protein
LVSRSLKDIFTTGFSQAAVLVFSIILLKLLPAAFSEAHFGLFNLVRRWDMVLLPILTLNMSIGVARYVSYEKEKGSFFLHVSLAITALLSLILFTALLLFPGLFSKLLFHSPDYDKLVMILVLFLLANLLHLLAYSYFRGKLDMNAANLMRTLFFGFPLLPAGIALLVKSKTGNFAPLSLLYMFFLTYSVFGIAITIFFLRKDFSLSVFKAVFGKVRENIKKSAKMLGFSLYRIPGVFFSAMVLGFPVLYAGHKLSLEAAGYIGIVVAILRLFEVFSMPFNMIFLPRFSILQRENDQLHIVVYSQVVLDFIITFLPFCGVIAFGLMPFIVKVWFGPSYLVAAKSVAFAVLFSTFYLAFALIRGILDGLFEFPYTNIISFAGFAVIALLSFIIGGDTFTLAIAFICGLVALGLLSAGMLIYLLGIPIPWQTLLKSLTAAVVIFIGLHIADSKVADLGLKSLHSFAIGLSYRILLVIVLWLAYWKKTLWYKEVTKRLNVKGEEAKGEV